MTKIKIGIAITLVVGLATLGYLYRAELQRGARQAATIVQQQAELTDQQRRIQDLARQRDAAEKVAAREKERAVKVRRESRRLRDEIGKLEEKNKAVRDWGDTAMPAELVDLLRRAPDDRAD